MNEGVSVLIMFSDLFVAAFILRLLSTGYAGRVPVPFLAGVIVVCMGLLFQSIKNGYMILFGPPFPPEAFFPLWALKDFGAVICTVSFLHYSVRYGKFLKD